jgi:prepilin peptidase CpaA
MAVIAPQWLADFWALGVLAAVLICAAVTDLRTGKIHNWTTYPAAAIGLIGHTLIGGIGGDEHSLGLSGSLAGLAVGFVPMLLAWQAGGIGGGDAKLMGAVGALAGWRFALATLFYGLAVAACMALIVMLRRRIMRKTLGRVFRFLVLLFTPTTPADPAAEDSPKIAFGVALCIGAALALIEVAVKGPVAEKFLIGI